MASPKKLVAMAKKWKKMAIGSDESSLVASKGHFVVYTLDGRRFVVPLDYLNRSVFRELLDIAEEEFGLPRDQPITLPCDAAFMDCVVTLLRRRMPEEMEKALLCSMDASQCSGLSLASHELGYQQSLHGF